jgi:hypothetical protein
MKKNYFLGQLLLLAFIVGVTSCKKDTSITTEESLVNQKDIAGIKNGMKTKN